MYIYGGFSKRCQDFCSDVWYVSLPRCEAEGECTWVELGVMGNTGPGRYAIHCFPSQCCSENATTGFRRWRMAVTSNQDIMYMFGGHRLWHGFSADNSLFNRWKLYNKYPFGGYMDDLWMYSRSKANTVLCCSSLRMFTLIIPANDSWKQVLPWESCYSWPGDEWEQRDEMICTSFWPEPRASAAMVYFNSSLYLHGGYRVIFPYPHTGSRGSGSGVSQRSESGISAFDTLPYYLHDLWVYRFGKGGWVRPGYAFLSPRAFAENNLWEEITPANATERPAARRDHTMIVAGSVFFLVGGYSGNYHFMDFWIYNTCKKLAVL